MYQIKVPQKSSLGRRLSAIINQLVQDLLINQTSKLSYQELRMGQRLRLIQLYWLRDNRMEPKTTRIISRRLKSRLMKRISNHQMVSRERTKLK